MDICTGSEYYHVRLVTSRTDFLKSHIQDSNAMQDVKCAWLLGFARLLGVAWCRNSIDFLHLPTDIALSSKLDPENWKTLPKCYSTPRCCDFMSYSKVYQLSSNWYLPSKHHVLVKITRTVQPLRIALHLFVTLGSTCAWVKVEIALPSVLMSIAMDFDPGNLCFFLRSYSVSFRKPNELLCWANLLRSESPTMEFFFMCFVLKQFLLSLKTRTWNILISPLLGRQNAAICIRFCRPQRHFGFMHESCIDNFAANTAAAKRFSTLRQVQNCCALQPATGCLRAG